MQKIYLLSVLSLFIAVSLYSQSTTLTLPTADNTSSFDVINSGTTNLLKVEGTGKVGLQQANPRAQLEVGGYNGILSTGAIGSGDVIAPGAGARFMWYPRTGAFRAGVAESNYWDDDGTGSPKLALYSIAMGYRPRATGSYSVAIGTNNYATGQHSLALGSYTQALADYAIAIGYDAWATGVHSMCIGAGLSTNGKEGAVLIGDNTPFARVYASSNNQLTMRFTGGFRLWSSFIDSVSGVYMRPNQSGWSNYCDRNKKENFEELDFENLLAGIKSMPVTKWNYKASDPSIKYIGPVAQDFYAAFQLGGTDSLGINTICIDGVTLAGVKGLINRTDELKSAVEELKVQSERIVLLEKTIKKQEEVIAELQGRYEEMKTIVAGIVKDSNAATTVTMK
ncbi:MAG TPA: tail fiber domain-containing protein [bacterium]|nr:tail fiber domain-containing protein [bacterium]HPN44963.1 tail fiber domain-containing protein [bacterium]